MNAPQPTAPAAQVPLDQLEAHTDWTECAAFRFKKTGDGYRLEIARSLDAITDPSICSECDGEGQVVANPLWPDPRGETWGQCGSCHGRGRSEN